MSGEPSNPEVQTNVPKELKEIGYFRVTDRPLYLYLKLGHINSESIPSGGTVVNIGSGFEQKFERGLKRKRPDLKLFPIDASLAIPTKEEEYQKYRDQEIKLEVKPENEALREPSEEERQKRAKNILKTSIAAVAPNLPIKSSDTDLIIDLAGAFLYLPPDNEREKYLSELIRILKPKGEAHIYPIEYYGETVNMPNSRKRIENEKKQLEKISIELNINHEFYEEYDPELKEVRLGLIIKKPEQIITEVSTPGRARVYNRLKDTGFTPKPIETLNPDDPNLTEFHVHKIPGRHWDQIITEGNLNPEDHVKIALIATKQMLYLKENLGLLLGDRQASNIIIPDETKLDVNDIHSVQQIDLVNLTDIRTCKSVFNGEISSPVSEEEFTARGIARALTQAAQKAALDGNPYANQVTENLIPWTNINNPGLPKLKETLEEFINKRNI